MKTIQSQKETIEIEPTKQVETNKNKPAGTSDIMQKHMQTIETSCKHIRKHPKSERNNQMKSLKKTQAKHKN